MKLRNLILSLFLAAAAAAFTACDGTTGPAGGAGGAGPAGPAGPAGDAGKAGDSADEVMRSYAYLKVWGKPEGKAACSDPVLKSMDAFPGPATLPKLTSSTTPAFRAAPPGGPQVLIPGNAANLGDPTMDAHKGRCSNAVFDMATGGGGPPAFSFVSLTNGTVMTETPRKGTTPTLRNATLTEIKKEFREGEISVNLNNNGSEYAGRDLLFTRCDIGRVPFGGLRGTYRAIKITEDEYLLKTDAQGTAAKDTGTGSKVTKTTSQICVRFSAPGAVKCYITETAQKRKTSDDKLDTTANSETVTEQIALYKDGKMTPVDPKPDSKTNLVPGETPPGIVNTANTGKRPFGNASASPPFITFYPTKLCNFFAGGVIGTAGAAAAAPSTGGGGGSPGGGGQTPQQKCEGAGDHSVPAAGAGGTPVNRWNAATSTCNCPTGTGTRRDSQWNRTTGKCECASGTWGEERDRDNAIVGRGC